MKSMLALCPLLLALSACGSTEPPPPSDQDRELQKALQAPLDKAKAMEEEMRKARKEQDAKIQEQGG